MKSLSILTCISSIMIFILLAFPGYGASKYKLLSGTQISGLSVLLVNFLWPSMVINTMASVTINEKLIHMALYTGSITSLSYLISLIIAFFYVRIRDMPKFLEGILIFAISFNNTGFIGMPFIKHVLGNEALFIASIIELINDIFIFTIGVMLVQPSSDTKRKMDLKSLLSPGFLSVLIGLFIFSFHLCLPEIIAKPIGYMSDATTAIAMFLVGAQLGEFSLKELFEERIAYEICFFRLIVIPFLLFIVLFLIVKNRTLADAVLVIMFGMPVATCIAIFARQYKGDYHLATKCVMMSTLCSVITLPIWLLLTSQF